MFASSGASKVIHVFACNEARGDLVLVDQIIPPGSSICTGMTWNDELGILACMQENSPLIIFWDVDRKERKVYDVGTKDLTFIKWCKRMDKDINAACLAVGTGKGEVYFVNPVQWKCATVKARVGRKRVRYGEWSKKLSMLFAFQCEDSGSVFVAESTMAKNVPVLREINIKGVAMSMAFNYTMPSTGKHPRRDRGNRVREKSISGDEVEEENERQILEEYSQHETLSINVGGEKLVFCRIADGEQMELSFQARYGQIIAHHWMSDALLVVGFYSGYVIIIDITKCGRELFCVELPQGSAISSATTKFCYASDTRVAAVSDGNYVTFIDLNSWQQARADIIPVSFNGTEEHFLSLSSDGSTLTVCGVQGNLWHYATRHFLQREQHSINLTAAHQFLWEELLRPVSSQALALSAMLAVSFLTVVSANLLGTSPSYFLCSFIGVTVTM
jgi:hypothetical protein